MPLSQAIVYGIIQGLTEFLPVSSTAHLVLAPWFFHWIDPGLTFDVALHVGTLAALLAYYWRDWVDLLAGAFGSQKTYFYSEYADRRKLLWWMVVATIPGAVAGAWGEKYFEDEARYWPVIAASLIGVAILMFFAERYLPKRKSLNQMTFMDTFVVGCFQAVALIPGVSRSGITITAGMFRGMKRGDSARFSFLLASPIVAGAAFKKGLEVYHTGLPPEMRVPMICGIILSAVVGWITLRFLTSFYEKFTLKGFMVYRIALGILILVVGFLR